jgi:hypothetical protein
MERITYHGENIQGYEQALQKMDPDAYNKYAAEFRQKTNDANVIPFNKDEGIMSVTDEVVETPAKASENLNIPEWAQKSLDRLNELKRYYSKNPPNNKDTLDLYNKQIVQREKALRYTLESGGDEAMFEKLRIGPKTKIPEVFETNKYIDLLPTDQEKTMRNVNRQFGFDFVEDTPVSKKPAKAGEGKFTKAQVLIERLKNTIKENPNDKYVQETFPGFIKEIEAKPELADDANVQEAFGLTDLSETADQRLVEYPDGTLDFYTKGNQGGMESVQSLIDELGISQDEALRIKQLEPEDQILEITKLRTLKNKPKKAEGGRVNFNQGSGPAAGLASLTPHQEYYNDKIIRDNMDFIREDMSLYVDEDNRSDFQKFIDSLTRDDVYDEYDERKGYTGMFKENFTTKDGKDITIPYKPDRNLDIQGLLQLFDESDRGVSSSDETIFNSSDILGKFSSKEREV